MAPRGPQEQHGAQCYWFCPFARRLQNNYRCRMQCQHVTEWQNDSIWQNGAPVRLNRMNSRFLCPAGGDAAVSRLEMIELDSFARWSQRPANCVWRVNTSAYRRLSAFKNTGTHWHPTARHDVCCMFSFGCTAHCLCRRNVGLRSQLGLLGQLSLVSLRGRLIEYQLRLR